MVCEREVLLFKPKLPRHIQPFFVVVIQQMRKMRLEPFVQVANEDMVEVIAMSYTRDVFNLVKGELHWKPLRRVVYDGENHEHGASVVVREREARRFPYWRLFELFLGIERFLLSGAEAFEAVLHGVKLELP